MLKAGTKRAIEVQRRIWNVVRTDKLISAGAAARTATLNDLPISEAYAKRYLTALAHAGYVTRTNTGSYRVTPKGALIGSAPHMYEVTEVMDTATMTIVARTGPAGFSGGVRGMTL